MYSVKNMRARLELSTRQSNPIESDRQVNCDQRKDVLNKMDSIALDC